jgi:hypothetical protein
MAYQFEGFFCCGNETVLSAAATNWPLCSVRQISQPFCGFGLSCARPMEAKTNGETAAIEQQIRQVRSGLIPWSRNFPELTFVYLAAECFGGDCLYGGYACRNGVVLQEETFDDNDDLDASRSSLRRLLRFLGLEADYFEPLTRGYFDGSQAST